MTTKYKKFGTITALLSLIFIMACTAGPTKRYVDGTWDVSENICSSDPDQPELADMRSEFRRQETSGMSFERKITIFHLDRTVLGLTQKFTRGGTSGEMTQYGNTAANPVLKTTKITNTREQNEAMRGGFEEFFSSDPNIDAKKAQSACLYRGQR